MSLAALFGFALAIGAFFLWKRKLSKIVTLCALTVGSLITAGIFHVWGQRLAAAASEGVASLSKATVGYSIGFVITLLLALNVVHDLWPKHKANTLTVVSALLLPIFFVVTGIPGVVGDVVGAGLSAIPSGAAAVGK
jgi:hypothetical protein